MNETDNKRVYPEKPLTREETFAVLERFFGECLKYWERELGVDSDISNEAYLCALREIPKTYPYSPNGRTLDPDVVDDFRLSRYMDCFGPVYAQRFLMDYPFKQNVLSRFQERFQTKDKPEAVVSATKRIIVEEPLQVRITGATLLSREEYEQNRDLVYKREQYWWLRSHDMREGGYADTVYATGEVGPESADKGLAAVKPALYCDLASSGLVPGDKITLSGQSYTAIRGDYLLMDERIGVSPFCAHLNEPNPPLYETSDVKKMVDRWYQQEFGIKQSKAKRKDADYDDI